MFSFDTTRFFVPSPGTYTIEQRIISYANRIFFIDYSGQKFCVKMWRPHDNLLYRTKDQLARARYLREGFCFNRQRAPGVYVGIAPIQLILKDGENEDNASALTLFEIFTSPQKNDLEDGKEYALVMNRLDDRWQLSNLLPKALANRKGMEVLAQHIARMHRRLSKDPRDLANALQIGNKDKLLEKLNLNKDLFLEALEVLSLPEEEENRYTGILPILFSAFANYQNDFIQREETQHIKRCHGDLKAPNLWLYPVEKGMTDLLKYKTCLLALDCIDFMPEFCHIDTLSDIAMLAIDIELYSMNGAEKVEDGSSEKSLATYFLETYLKQAQEQHLNVWRLLNYYMVEKAMIGMYGNILNDKQVEVGKRYLHLAYKHVMNLQLL